MATAKPGQAIGELLVWFVLGCVLVNIVMHARDFTRASNSTFAAANTIFSDLTSRKG